MFKRSVVASAVLVFALAGSLVGCATPVPNESMSVIDGNDILTADLGADVSARGVVLAAVLLVAGNVEKGLAEGTVTLTEVYEARIAIESGTLDMWRQRAELDEASP